MIAHLLDHFISFQLTGFGYTTELCFRIQTLKLTIIILAIEEEAELIDG